MTVSETRRPDQLRVAVKLAVMRNTDPELVRARLIRRGWPKGTCSKVVLVIRTVQSGVIPFDDAQNLWAAYELCKAIKQVQNGEDKPLSRALERMGR